MTPERFEHLAQAYGADLRRWPVAEQAQAQQVCLERPGWSRGVLDLAGSLDELLHAYAVAAPSAMLRDRVLAAAPRPRDGWRSRLVRGWRGWGMGLAAAGVAGLLAGAGSVSLLIAEQSADVTATSALDGQSVYSEAVAFGTEDQS